MRRIFYICDRRRAECKNCSPDCFFTTDIEHAVNFEKFDGMYWEKEKLNEEKTSERNDENPGRETRL